MICRRNWGRRIKGRSWRANWSKQKCVEWYQQEHYQRSTTAIPLSYCYYWYPRVIKSFHLSFFFMYTVLRSFIFWFLMYTHVWYLAIFFLFYRKKPIPSKKPLVPVRRPLTRSVTGPFSCFLIQQVCVFYIHWTKFIDSAGLLVPKSPANRLSHYQRYIHYHLLVIFNTASKRVKSDWPYITSFIGKETKNSHHPCWWRDRHSRLQYHWCWRWF